MSIDLKQHTVDLIHSYCQLLDNRGITYVIPSDAELLAMELWEVRRVLKELIDLSRTPS